MSTDIRLAFDNLEARADASGDDNPSDRISLRDHIVNVEIGAFQAERGTTQRVCFNVVVEVRPPQQPLHDDVDRILSYDTITEAIALALAEERLNLLETLAERIAELILHNPRSRRVFVRIEKLDRGPGALGVEIVRERDASVAEDVDTGEAAQPMVVFLSNEAVASPLLSGWIDQLEKADMPVILCVDAAEISVPQASVAAAQRRIDLLAIEQNAWVLAGKDRRCVVMGSRTELDWAVQNNQISVWAPSKIVLDSIDVVVPQDSPMALITWFCEQIGAERLIAIGSPPLGTTAASVTNVALDQAVIL